MGAAFEAKTAGKARQMALYDVLFLGSRSQLSSEHIDSGSFRIAKSEHFVFTIVVRLRWLEWKFPTTIGEINSS